MKYLISDYEKCDIGYDQGDVVISQKVLVMKYVISGYEPKGVSYEL